MGKVFGLFPIDISSKDPQKIIFKWQALRTIFSFFFIVSSTITSVCALKHQIGLGQLTAKNIVGILFFSSCTIICILFFKISQKLQALMKIWMKTELNFLCANYQLPVTSWSLHKRIMFVTVLYLILSTLEHVFYASSEITKLVHDLELCNQTDFDTISVYIHRHLNFLTSNLPFPYNNFIGIFMEYLNISYTFFWNFLDLFIILISIGIAFLFEQINCRLRGIKGLIVNEGVWAEIRYHHVQVYQLLQFVNITMGEIFMFACFIDGYFILVQLLNITT